MDNPPFGWAIFTRNSTRTGLIWIIGAQPEDQKEVIATRERLPDGWVIARELGEKRRIVFVEKKVIQYDYPLPEGWIVEKEEGGWKHILKIDGNRGFIKGDFLTVPLGGLIERERYRRPGPEWRQYFLYHDRVVFIKEH
ncbi:hypothetical protein [Paenibacillus sp. 481]|uniref:hypothetical protein n=1 Tax=Paenibacillus sp. 481 TaxID=2835869 RepID=UPI001E5C6D06|nr:hypothetical protein [Paenibacillus sp. 481]UHA75022.1 hypothetical protein KIK04_08350 [Paenibacillus sp. 481]